jgi:hypothetical protein
MKNTKVIGAACLWMVIAGVVYAMQEIAPRDAADYRNRLVTVRGYVGQAYANEDGCFLNFYCGDMICFRACIEASRRSAFPPVPQVHFLNKEVLITGVVTEYDGKPQMVVNAPTDISIVQPKATEPNARGTQADITEIILRKQVERLTQRLQNQDARIAALELKIQKLELTLSRSGLTSSAGVSSNVRDRDVGYR